MSDATLSEQLRQVHQSLEMAGILSASFPPDGYVRTTLSKALALMPSLIERVEALESDMVRMAWTGFEEGYMAAFSGGVLSHDTVREAWLRSETYRINWGDLAEVAAESVTAAGSVL